MDLNNMSAQELKALWYDQFVLKAQTEHNLAAINQHLQKLQNEVTEEPELELVNFVDSDVEVA